MRQLLKLKDYSVKDGTYGASPEIWSPLAYTKNSRKENNEVVDKVEVDAIVSKGLFVLVCTVFSTTQGRYLYSEIKLRLLADYGNLQKEIDLRTQDF